MEVDSQFWKDFRWAHEHHTEMLESFKDQWVAVSNQDVVASGKNLEAVKKEALNKTGRIVPLIFIDCGEHIYGC